MRLIDTETSTLQWRHNGYDGVSNHQSHHCFKLNRLSNLRVTGLCAGNSPVTGEFPVQMASNAENISILRRHHENDYKVKASVLSPVFRYGFRGVDIHHHCRVIDLVISINQLWQTYYHLDPWEQTSIKLEYKHRIFIEENAFEDIALKKNGGHFIPISWVLD